MRERGLPVAIETCRDATERKKRRSATAVLDGVPLAKVDIPKTKSKTGV